MDSNSVVCPVLPVLGIDIARCKFDVALRAKAGSGAFKFKVFNSKVEIFELSYLYHEIILFFEEY